MNKILLSAFLIAVFSCCISSQKYHIYRDAESGKLYVIRNDKTVFKTKSRYWSVDKNYITEVLTNENEIKVYLYDCIKNELTEYPFDTTINLKGNNIYRLHQRPFINSSFDFSSSDKTLFFYFAYKPRPGIYSMNLEEECNSINLVYPTQEAISFLKVSDQYLCFISPFDSLWVKSFGNDSLYGKCLSVHCEVKARSNNLDDLLAVADSAIPWGYRLIESNRLLVRLEENLCYFLSLDNLTEKYVKSDINLAYKGNYVLDNKLYFYTVESGEKFYLYNKIAFNSLDLNLFKIDSNVFEVSKPEDYFGIYVDEYSVDKEYKIHIYITKMKPSLNQGDEYDKWYDYIVYDLKKRKVISKEEDLEKIDRYLVR